MMRKRKNSEILYVLLTCRFLLFLFSFFPAFLFASNDDLNEIKDSAIYKSEDNTIIHISEGTIIYNRHLIHSNAQVGISIKLSDKQQNKKITRVSKFAENKIKTPSPVKNKVTPVINKHYKNQPVDPASFFSKNSGSESIILPVNKKVQNQELIKQYYFFILNDFASEKSSSLVFTDINSNAHQWQNHVRPPPIFQ